MTPFEHAKTSGDMGGSFWANLDAWGWPGTRVMTIFVFHVAPHISNMGYMKVYQGLQALGGISSFFSSNFMSNVVSIMSGDPLGPEL